MVAPTCFGITFPYSGSVPSVFLVLLNLGATCHNTPIHNILLTAPQLSNSQKALGTLTNGGNVMPKHVGATIIINKLNE
jgi:hypothetical protein